MRRLWVLAWRLARAGGTVRWATIAFGAGVVALMGLAAQAVPGAMYPPGQTYDVIYRMQFAVIIAACLLPAVAMLVTVARLSSDLRDRRLAALRLVGVSAGRVTLVAGLEIVGPALLGVLGGGAAFVALAPLADRLVALGPAWFRSTLRVPAGDALLTLAGVVLLCVVVTMLPVRRAVRDPLPARREATPRPPSAWRLAVTVPTFAPLAWLAWSYGRPPYALFGVVYPQSWAFIALLVGGVFGVLCVALLPALIATWCARVLVRSGRPPARLAGRTLQVEPSSSGRLAAGFGVSVFLLLAAVGLTQIYLVLDDVQVGRQALGDGPQKVTMVGDTPLTGTEVATIEHAEGVAHLIPVYDVVLLDGHGEPLPGPETIFVGTCADLAVLDTPQGPCPTDAVSALGAYFGTASGEPEYGVTGAAVSLTDTDTVAIAANGRATRQPVAPEILVIDPAETNHRWGRFTSHSAFVPIDLVPDAPVVGAIVIADGGTAVTDRLQDVGDTLDLTVTTTDLTALRAVEQALVTIWTLMSIAVTVALGTYAISAIDRARAGRRRTARLVAIGIPSQVLQRAQLWQTLIPLATALTVALPLGLILIPAMAALGEGGVSVPSIGLPVAVFLAATAVSGALVALAAVTAAHVRLTPDLLRSE